MLVRFDDTNPDKVGCPQRPKTLNPKIINPITANLVKLASASGLQGSGDGELVSIQSSMGIDILQAAIEGICSPWEFSS